MKKYFTILAIILVAAMCTSYGVLYHNNIKLKKANELLHNNRIAHALEIEEITDSLVVERGVFLLTIDEMSTSKDSVLRELKVMQEDLKIANSKVKEYQHMLATIKVDTVINITEIINDSCEFNLKIDYNPQTIFYVESKKIDGQDFLSHSADISASFSAVRYTRSEWKEPKFVKRLIGFKWGKYHTDRYVLQSNNDMVKINSFKVIKMIE